MTREEARDYLHDHSIYDFTIYRPYQERPQKLYGYYSESTPGVLLACKESFEVASKVYSPAFASLGALPQTYFNFDLDTLYLDANSLKNSLQDTFNLEWLLPLQEDLSLVDLRKVRNLAIFWNDNVRAVGAELARLIFSRIPYLFPHLDEFIIVEDHFTSCGPQSSKNDEKYNNLKYAKSSVGWEGFYTYRLNGYLVDGSILRPGHPLGIPETKNWHAEAASQWTRTHPKGEPYSLPMPLFKSLITEEDEARLLNEAYTFETKYNTGVWYINPKDPNDFEEYPWDDIDMAALEEAYRVGMW